MSFPIIEQIRDYLQRHGPASVQMVVGAIPELEAHGREQRAFLLMRLDPSLEFTDAGLWAIRGLMNADEQSIRTAAEKYFSSIKRPGAPLSSAVEYIHQETQIEPPQVRETLEKYYVLHGPNIFNRRKDKGEE